MNTKLSPPPAKQGLNKSLNTGNATCTKTAAPKLYGFTQNLLYLNMAFLLFSSNPVMAYDYGDPTNLEQAHLELINRTRANPTQEAQRLNINLFEGVPAGAITGDAVQPLSSNALLLTVARNHSNDMLKQNYFAHNNLAGLGPFDRMKAGNYNYQGAGENIAWRGSTASLDQTATALQLHNDLFVDENYPDRGHRTNMLNANYREIGVGLSFGAFSQSGRTYNAGMITTDFGWRSNSKPIILGVVYDDKNADQFYTAGEGIAKVSVALSANNSTQTASAGGYGLEVDPNTDYTLTFTHPSQGTATKTVRVNNLNVKVDALLSEFSDNATVNQCATFTQSQLSIPCITLAGSVYKAELVVLNNNPLQFGLQSSALNPQAAAAQCGAYNTQTNTAKLNCVSVGNTHYWAELQLKPTARGWVYELGNYGILP